MEPVLCDQYPSSNLNKYQWRQQQQQQQDQQPISEKIRHFSHQQQHQGDQHHDIRSRSDSFSSGLTMGRRGSGDNRVDTRFRSAMTGYSHGTLPRHMAHEQVPGTGAWSRDGRDNRLSMSSHNIADVEKMYLAMKNLNDPLPSAGEAGNSASGKMPALYNLNRMHSAPGGPASSLSMESLVCSVMGDIPPPPAPVKSHAVLEYSLGHSIPISPRTPGTMRKFDSTLGSSWSPSKTNPCMTSLPPLPPKRSSSRVGDLNKPGNLNLTDTSIYSRPKLLPDRTSLMSTGSSDSGTGSSSDQDQPLSPGSGSQFSWPQPDNMSMYSDANTSMTSHNGLYVKMRPQRVQKEPVFSGEGAEYMNFLYSAVQSQGGGGSVESAMSPYLAMTSPHAASSTNGKHYYQAVSQMSAIYDQIQSHKGSNEALNVRIGDQSSLNSGHQRKNYQALEQFRQLMVEVERKRHYRVGLNLFNTLPDVGVDYLVKQNFIELSPLSVAKFLFNTPSLSKLKVGQYLGQFESAFCAKVLSLFVQEFDFTGLRFDKAVRKLMTCVKMPENPDKIEKIIEAFVKRFVKCNSSSCNKSENTESLITLGCSIIQLNSDIHVRNSSMKAAKKLTEKDFLSKVNLHDMDQKLLKNVYKSVKKKPLVTDPDHVYNTEVLQQSLLGPSIPHLAAPHRRLVCLCSLYVVKNINTDSDSEARSHPRVAWLFNDLLVIVKQSGKGSHVHKENFPLLGLEVSLFKAGAYRYGVQITRKRDREILVTLSMDTEQDQYKFVMDLQESIFEMESMHRAAREANMIK